MSTQSMNATATEREANSIIWTKYYVLLQKKKQNDKIHSAHIVNLSARRNDAHWWNEMNKGRKLKKWENDAKCIADTGYFISQRCEVDDCF